MVGGGRVKKLVIFCGRHKWMTPQYKNFLSIFILIVFNVSTKSFTFRVNKENSIQPSLHKIFLLDYSLAKDKKNDYR